MSSCVPPPAQSRWPLPVCTRRRALAALSALEVFSPAHATAGGVDGAPVDAVVVVPGGRLVAANVHDWVQGGAERRRAKRRSLIENDPGPGRALLWQREATKRNGPSAMPWAGPLYSMQRADRLQCVRIRPWPSSAAVQQCSSAASRGRSQPGAGSDLRERLQPRLHHRARVQETQVTIADGCRQAAG